MKVFACCDLGMKPRESMKPLANSGNSIMTLDFVFMTASYSMASIPGKS